MSINGKLQDGSMEIDTGNNLETFKMGSGAEEAIEVNDFQNVSIFHAFREFNQASLEGFPNPGRSNISHTQQNGNCSLWRSWCHTNSHTLCSTFCLRKDHSLSFIFSKWKNNTLALKRTGTWNYIKSWQKDSKELFLSKQLSVTQWIKCLKQLRMFQGLKCEPAERREIVMT